MKKNNLTQEQIELLELLEELGIDSVDKWHNQLRKLIQLRILLKLLALKES